MPIFDDVAWNFTLDNFGSVWSLMVQLGLLLISLLLGNLLVKTIPFLRKAFIPASLLGGVLLLLLNLLVNFIVKKCGVADFQLVDRQEMQVITYHALAIGFIAMTLKIVQKDRKISTLKVIQNGVLEGGTYMLQAVLGLVTVLIFFWAGYKVDGEKIFYDSGILLPLAFGQGPGNAMTWDLKFSELFDFGGNGSVGLSLASLGFIVACVVGVVYINIFKRKGQIQPRDDVVVRKVTDFEEEGEIGDVESADKFSIQIGLVVLAYALAFGIMCVFNVTAFTKGIAWSLNFIWGVLAAFLIKLTLKGLRKAKIVKKKYVNNYQMDRIAGFAFDLMIIAGVAAIDIQDVKKFIAPIAVLAVVGTISTYIYIRLITKHCFKDLAHEMFLVNYGTLTGTASNGVILLREIDPAFTTNASSIFILSQVPSMICVAPLLLLLNFSAKSLKHTLIAGGIFLGLFIGYTLFLVFSPKFKRKKPPKIVGEE